MRFPIVPTGVILLVLAVNFVFGLIVFGFYKVFINPDYLSF
jgi:hypothetical protein